MSLKEDTVVLLIQVSETLGEVLQRVKEIDASDDVCTVFPKNYPEGSARLRQDFFALIKKRGGKTVLALHNHTLSSLASEKDIEVIEKRGELSAALEEHPDYESAIRHFSAFAWEEIFQKVSDRLQRLSVQRLRIWCLLVVSIILFFMVIFVAIPSSTIRVWPRVDLVNFTANVMLVSSGSVLELHEGQHTLPLLPIKISVERSLTFDQVSKNFTGENAEVLMTVINESDELYSLRAGTRLVNQAGMIFRTLAPIDIPPAKGLEPGTVNVDSRADPEDLYGEIVGERGNVPAGLRWEFPGLSIEERKIVYARNVENAEGGITRYGSLVQEKDLKMAQLQIKQELLRAAKFRIEEEVESLRARSGEYYVVFAGSQYEVLTSLSFSGITIPTQLVGETVSSIPIEGELTYMMLAYNKDALLHFLQKGLGKHVERGYTLVAESVDRDRVAVYVIEYDDDLEWVKITADLTGKQRSILSPFTVEGRIFQQRLRDMVQGKSVEEARRVIQNFPEVERVKISIWPPWQKLMPQIPNHIEVLPEVD